MTRGFNKKDAQKMLVKAGFNEILSKIETEDLKNEILTNVDKILV